jgi:hypothetical protein
MATGPFGWTRTTTSRVKNPACSVHTTKGSCSWSEWRDSNPHLKAWKARRQPLPHIRVGSAPISSIDTQTELGPVAFTGPSTLVSCQRPRSRELVGGKGFEPNRSLGENGFTARQRTIRSYRPWRQRQDSNPDPRGLEARMLPLHHAVVGASPLDRFRDKTPHSPDAGFLPCVRPKPKRPSRGSP